MDMSWLVRYPLDGAKRPSALRGSAREPQAAKETFLQPFGSGGNKTTSPIGACHRNVKSRERLWRTASWKRRDLVKLTGLGDMEWSDYFTHESEILLAFTNSHVRTGHRTLPVSGKLARRATCPRTRFRIVFRITNHPGVEALPIDCDSFSV